MFAIFKSGGKQYKAKAGDIIKLEKLEGEAGSVILLKDILMVGSNTVEIGADAAKGKVSAEIIEQGKGEKIIVFKKKRRHNYRRKNGHRQLLTTVRIMEITSPSGETVKAEARVLKKPASNVDAKANAKKALMGEVAVAAKPAKKVAAPKAEKVEAAPKAKKAAAPKAEKAEKTEKKPAAKKAASVKKED